MKKLIMLLTFSIAASSILTSCDRAASLAQTEKEKQQAAEDKKALRGKFEKSPGKSY